MAKPKDDAWVVKLDEHHPNHGVAAKYADQQSRIASLRACRDGLRRLEAREDKLPGEVVQITELKQRITELEQDITDHNEKEDA